MQKLWIFALSAILFNLPSAKASSTLEKDFSSFFGNHSGTIVIYDQKKDLFIVHNKERSETRFSPFSTFKIPNSLIALETKTISDVDTPYLWDTTKYQSESWWPSQWHDKHTMRTAFKYSVVPFYRSAASLIGTKKMDFYVQKFNYGNRDISSGIDNFWLTGSIKISALEQISFLRALYYNQFGLSKRTIALVKSIMVQDSDSTAEIRAKTGAGDLDKNKVLGWYVGYIEKGKDVFFFAMNIDGASISEIKDKRLDITKAILRDLKMID